MTDQAQVSVKISGQEYELLKIFRGFDERRRMHVYEVIENLKDLSEGTPGTAFIQDLERLRGTLDAEEFEAFKKSLSVSDQIDPTPSPW